MTDLRICTRSRLTSERSIANAPLRLLMTGYVNYFSATSLYAAWQAGLKADSAIRRSAAARMAHGSAFPAKRVSPRDWSGPFVVDLTGKLPAGARRIRLMTNLQIYWDQVLIDQSAERGGAHERTAARPGDAALPRIPEAN